MPCEISQRFSQKEFEKRNQNVYFLELGIDIVNALCKVSKQLVFFLRSPRVGKPDYCIMVGKERVCEFAAPEAYTC